MLTSRPVIGLWLLGLICSSNSVLGIRTLLSAAGESNPAIWTSTTWNAQAPVKQRGATVLRTRALKAIALKSERTALLAFKSLLSVTDAAKLSTWVEGTDHCDGTWLGVQCVAKGRYNRVYLIDLSDQGLLFSLSSISFAALPALQVLWLQGNTIRDGLDALTPTTGSNSLKKLVELRLHDAGLTGSLPSALPPKLKRLHLQNNLLSSVLPAELATSTPELEVLLLSANNFQGSIPETWRGLTKLKTLSVENNANLTGCVPAWAQAAVSASPNPGATSAAGAAIANTQLCGVCGLSLCSQSNTAAVGTPIEQTAVQLPPQAAAAEPAAGVNTGGTSVSAPAAAAAGAPAVAGLVAPVAADATAVAAGSAPAAAVVTPTTAAATPADPAAAAAVAPAVPVSTPTELAPPAAAVGAPAVQVTPPPATQLTGDTALSGSSSQPALLPPAAQATVPTATTAAATSTALPAAAAAAVAPATPAAAVPGAGPAATAAAPAAAVPGVAPAAAAVAPAAVAPAVAPATPAVAPAAAVPQAGPTTPATPLTMPAPAAAATLPATPTAPSILPTIAAAGSQPAVLPSTAAAASPVGSAAVPVSTAAAYPPGLGPIDPALTVVPDNRKPTYI